ncbi:MAG: EAL domain-containing protein, partial [Bacilli bacterium]
LENDIFAIVMKDTEDFVSVKKYIAKVESYFKKPLEVANSEILVTISSGILLVGKDKGPLVGAPMDLVTKAKLALNRCKQIKNQSYYLFDDELESESYDESQIINDLKSGIQNNEFEVYFQPQYDISKKTIFGFEALIRWNHPKYKSVSPMKYITIFEEKGMINLLGDFITKETFAFANTYLKNKNWHISVNVSPVQIMQPGFVHNFLQEYEKYDFKSGQVAIEITENFIIKNKNEVISKLNILRQKGIHVHIDDFGTGYSSLLYLKDLPIDAIKLDYQFTKLIDMDEKSRLIVSHIIEIAKNLELEVVAEGVETDTQQTFLLKNKCSIIQGYFIAKPMNLTDTLAFIANEEKKKEVNK